MTETLKTIVRLNWLSVRDGSLGAINSVFSNSKVDNTNMQAEEFWVAVNYSLCALLILHVSFVPLSQFCTRPRYD